MAQWRCECGATNIGTVCEVCGSESRPITKPATVAPLPAWRTQEPAKDTDVCDGSCGKPDCHATVAQHKADIRALLARVHARSLTLKETGAPKQTSEDRLAMLRAQARQIVEVPW